MASGRDGGDVNPTGTLTSPSLQPAPPLPTLPFDLIAEIMCRLPVKLLLQLRCLSKSFNSLISSDSKFAKKHLRFSTKRQHVMVSSKNNTGEFVLFDSPIASHFPTSSTVVPTQLSYPNCLKFGSCLASSTCDGILCLTMNNGASAFLWNPCITTFKILPPLVNNKSSLSSAYTFGFDKFIRNYKLIAMSFFIDKCEVSVHTLGSMDSWRRIQDFPYSGMFPGVGIFVGGTVNWLPFDNVTSLPVIVSLDLENESYQKIPQPDFENRHWTLGALKDCLCIYANSGSKSMFSDFLDVWIMKEYGNKASWTKLYCVPHMKNWGLCDHTKTLYISNNDQVLMSFYDLENSKLKLVVHDSKNGTFMISEIQNLRLWMVTEVYIESLISPCSDHC